MNKVIVFFCFLCIFINTYSQDIINESFEDEIAPSSGWTVKYDNTYPYENTVSHTNKVKFSGNRSFKFSSINKSDGYKVSLFSKELVGVTNDHYASFYYKPFKKTARESFQVIFTNNLNPTESDFANSEIITTDENVWKEYYIQCKLGAKYLCIRYLSEEKFALHIDSLRVFKTKEMTLQAFEACHTNVRFSEPNAQNLAVARINIKTKDYINPLKLNSLTISTEGTSDLNLLREAKLYYSKSDSVFNENAIPIFDEYVFPKGKFSFQAGENKGIKLQHGDNYFFVTYDLDDSMMDLDDTEVIDIDIQKANVGGVVYEPTIKKMEGDIKIQKSYGGEIIVGRSADAHFRSLSQFVKSLMALGVHSSLTVLIEGGQYRGQVELGAVPNASKKNSITFKRIDETRSVVIQGTPTSNKNYILEIDNASYVTIDGFEFVSLDPNVCSLVKISGNTNNVIMRNCKLKGYNVSGDLLKKGSLLYSYDNSIRTNNTIENCVFNGGAIGIKLRNTMREEDLTIDDNSFSDQMLGGVYVENIHNLKFNDNIITASHPNFKYEGVNIKNLSEKAQIFNNNIIVNSEDNDKSYRGILIDGISNNFETEKYKLFNNMISMSSGVALELSQMKNVYVLNNNINVYGDLYDNAGCVFKGYFINSVFENNIVVNKSTGKALDILIRLSDSKIQNNVLLSNGEVLLAYDGSNYANIEEWRGTGNGIGSKSVNPFYVSDTDLHISNSDDFKFNKAYDFIDFDFDNEERKDDSYIGADEIVQRLELSTFYENQEIDVVERLKVSQYYGDTRNYKFEVKNTGNVPIYCELQVEDGYTIIDNELDGVNVDIGETKVLEVQISRDKDSRVSQNFNFNIKYGLIGSSTIHWYHIMMEVIFVEKKEYTFSVYLGETVSDENLLETGELLDFGDIYDDPPEAALKFLTIKNTGNAEFKVKLDFSDELKTQDKSISISEGAVRTISFHLPTKETKEIIGDIFIESDPSASDFLCPIRVNVLEKLYPELELYIESILLDNNVVQLEQNKNYSYDLLIKNISETETFEGTLEFDDFVECETEELNIPPESSIDVTFKSKIEIPEEGRYSKISVKGNSEKDYTFNVFFAKYIGLKENPYPNINIYPNPVKGNVHITNVEEQLQATVKDINGCIIKSKVVNCGNAHIDLNVASGLYILELKGSKGINISRLIVE
ncbi:MAG: T9SS type A sorting domain-containing protein [Hyphomicrobiales bacterium]